MRARRRLALTGFGGSLLWACATAPPPPTSPADFGLPEKGYTLTNLHPDDEDMLLSSVNYQMEGFIPMCTAVTIHEITSEHMTFTVDETQRRYEYEFHDTMVSPPGDHLRLYFGPECEKPTGGSGMSPLDLDGIEKGRVMPGMTKQGVIYAIGYPPPHETPNLESDTWKYWSSRFDTFDVVFADGIVTEIDD